MSDLELPSHADRLYALLPSVVRRRDEREGSPLRALLTVIADEAAVVEADIARLYRNWFIETCDDWALPYLADLVAYRMPDGRSGALGRNTRRAVARALSYRRRSGTATVLEELAHDITGWPSRVVEHGHLVCTTVSTSHRRPAAATARVRSRSELRKLNGPFDTTPRLASVWPARGQCYRRQSVALYVWRTAVRRLDRGEAARFGGDGKRFTVDPFGGNTVLYLRPDPHLTASNGSGVDPTVGVPNPIAPRHLQEPLPDGSRGASPDVYGPDASLAIYAGLEGSDLIRADRIEFADLKDWTGPASGRIAVDPTLGRILFPEEQAEGLVRVTWHEAAPSGIGAGSSAQVGGNRAGANRGTRPNAVPAGDPASMRSYDVRRLVGSVRSLADAISKPRDGATVVVIEFGDSGTYDFGPPDVGRFYRTEPGGRLEIRAAASTRPAVRHTSHPGKPWGFFAAEGSEIVLDGLLIRGPLALRGSGAVTIRDCTLLPPGDAEPVLTAEPVLSIESTMVAVRVERCIVGTIICTGQAADPMPLTLTDSVVQSIDGVNDAALRVDVRRCTVLGETRARHLDLAENSLFVGPVSVLHRQSGGMRYCFVPTGSLTPRRYECQPDLSGAEPKFVSKTYGRPGFAMLADDCPAAIVRGADDDGEMGALHDAFDFRKLSDLSERASDYVPAGFELSVVPVSPGTALENRS